MNIPKEVQEAAGRLVDELGGKIEHLGHYKGREAFTHTPSEPLCTGFPFIYLYSENKEVEEVTGFDALDIHSFFTPHENIEE